MASPGLRERKKAGTRRLIADVAGRLFAERGYEQVAVSDVAREAEISEQTVYNYWGEMPTEVARAVGPNLGVRTRLGPRPSRTAED